MAHATQPIPDVRKYCPDLPADAQQVILRAMAKDPARRYPTARALAEDLKTVASGKSLAYTGSDDGLTMPVEEEPAARAPAILAAPVLQTSSAFTPPPSTTPPPAARRSSFPPLWVIGAAVAALICVAVAGVALLAGVFSFGSAPGATRTAVASSNGTQAPGVTPIVVVVTSVPAPSVPSDTPLPAAPPSATSTPGPGVTNIRFCDRECNQSGARDVTSFPDGAPYIYVSMDFSRMKVDTVYSREWSNRDEIWVHYDCLWSGKPNVQRYVTLRDNTGGLRSGKWTITMAIEGKVAATASIVMGGSNQHWNPFAPPTQPCPDWK